MLFGRKFLISNSHSNILATQRWFFGQIHVFRGEILYFGAKFNASGVYFRSKISFQIVFETHSMAASKQKREEKQKNNIMKKLNLLE